MGKRICAAALSAVLAAALLCPVTALGSQEQPDAPAVVMPSGDMAVIVPAGPAEMLSGPDAQELEAQMAAYTPQESGLLFNRAEHYYYYDNLDPVAKQIYDVIYEVAKDPVSVGNIGLLMTDMDPFSDEFYDEFRLAQRTICFDHPELFWLYSGEATLSFSAEANSMNGFYFVYVMMTEPYTEFEGRMTLFNAAVADFLSDIDTSVSEYETVRQIHDKLIGQVDYNDPVAANISPAVNGFDLAHTAYGALVADSAGTAHYAVCDGYTLAFEYLLQQCGIETVFIGGMAGSTEADAGRHAWNMVKVDGAWYEVDTTWDDTGSQEDELLEYGQAAAYYLEALSDPVYRQKVDHFLFLVSTERIGHFVPGDEYNYYTKDGQMIVWMVGESIHHRLGSPGLEDEYDSDIFSMAPVSMQSYALGG